MSGFLGALNGLTGLSTNGILLLGTYLFSEYELPEQVQVGATQALTMHKMPGGRRVFDVTGPDPNAISWSGLLLGLGYQIKQYRLEAMRNAGNPHLLIVGFRAYRIIIKDLTFQVAFQRANYSIVCEIVPDIPDPPQAEAPQGTGNGQTPDTPQQAQDQGQQAVQRAQAAAPTALAPPLPTAPRIALPTTALTARNNNAGAIAIPSTLA